jgi:hypothetical protein
MTVVASFIQFRYAPNITWYVDTMNDVIQAADGPVQPDVMHSLIKVVAAGKSTTLHARLKSTERLED